jgi:Effector-associated domain 1
MKLNGTQIGELTDIIVAAFSRSELTILVRAELDVVLDDAVSTDDGWRTVAFNLIDSLDRQERAIELIRIIREARPQAASLIAFCDPLLAQANNKVQPHSVDGLQKAVVAFNAGFDNRNELFKYLNAYKELHDVLHELQSFNSKVAAAVLDREANPIQPLAEDVAIFLEDHVEMARASVRDIEFPDKPPSWVAKFVAAVEIITGSAVDKMPRQLERLKALPSEGLGPLNEKLFENASRLEPKKLVRSLNEILNALGTDGNPRKARLRSEVEEFRTLCCELDELISAHNLCQKIDDSLHEATGLPSVSPAELSDWDIAKKSLDELAAQRKNDKRVQRTNEAARLFEAANQAQAFRTLIERFDDLFMETDKALLKVTNKLPRKAMSLHTALGDFN